MLKARVNRITLTSGESIDIADGVTVIVGPNNAGKSLILSELSQYFNLMYHQQTSPPYAVQNVDVSLLETFDEFLERCRKEYREILPGTTEGRGLLSPQIRFNSDLRIQEDSLSELWHASGRFGQLAPIYQLHLPAGSRTGLTGDEGMFDFQQGMATTPLQKLFMNPELEEKLNRIVAAAFGQEITVHRHRGTGISLHLGKPSNEATWPPSQAYLDEMMTLPVINAQGDGMRSFIGIVLNIIAGNHSLLLIDEPEAFLHPPQARELGRVLTELRQEGVQIIVATHSSDIIQGVTSGRAGQTPVHIARISRQDNQNHVAAIPPGSIQNLYTDPLLKFSSVLDGLFYHGVVLCESEGDCTYYSAVYDELPAPQRGKQVDLHFTHCNGKDRIHKAVDALRAAKVPVASVFDVDILQDKAKLAIVVKAHGGDPEAMLTGLGTIIDDIDTYSQAAKRTDAKNTISTILGASTSPNLSNDEVKRIRDAVKQQSGWTKLKHAGESLLSADALREYKKLLAGLAGIGIFVVPVGELERFHPLINKSNKAAWLQEALATGAYKTAGTQQPFLQSIRTYIQEMQ